MDAAITYTVFDGAQLLFRGPLTEVVLNVKRKIGNADHSSVLIFNDTTGKTMDFNFRGNEKEVLKRLEVFLPEKPSKENLGPGRPKLGVMSREVSLLPRHWEWLATQAGGASSTLRKLVDEAKKKQLGNPSAKQAQERTYHFMSTIAGDFNGYEEALRALYQKDKKQFLSRIQDWPTDIRHHILQLAETVFS